MKQTTFRRDITKTQKKTTNNMLVEARKHLSQLDNTGKQFSKRKLVLGVLVAICLGRLLGELGRQLAGREQVQLAAWASWIGEVPTAAELYGDSSSDAPATDAFEDDDEDEELDSAATNEYPDNEGDADESYEDADGEFEFRDDKRRPPKADTLTTS